MAPYTVAQANGREVTAVRLPLPGPGVAGRLSIRRRVGQRLDLIAAVYLADATAFWRLCDANRYRFPMRWRHAP